MTAVVVILAAGAGTRLGGVAKALLPVDGTTFLGKIAATAREAGVGRGIVVIGPPFADEVAARARDEGFEVASNPDPSCGMATSVAIGFTAVARRQSQSGADVALLWPVDHPHVTAATIATVLETLAAHPDAVAAIPTHGGRGGHPPAIRRALWDQLGACGARPGGARGVLHEAVTVRVEVADAGVVRDVDAPEDLAR